MSTRSPVQDHSAPRDDPDGDAAFRRKLMATTAWLAVGGVTLAVAADALSGNLTDPVRFLLQAALAAVAAVSLALLRKGREALAGHLLLWGIAAAATCFAAFSGGVRAPAVMVYVVPIALATRVLGGRTAIALAAVSASVLFGLAWLDHAGLLPPDSFTSNPFRRAFTPVIVMGVLAVLWYFVAEDVAARVRRANEGRERLARSEAQLQLVVGNVSVMMAYFDVEDRCQWANEAYARDKGCPPAGLVGRRLEDILRPGEYTSETRRQVERAIAGERVSYLREYHDAAGGLRMLQIDMTPDRGPDGAVRGRIVAQRDVTAERGHERLLDAIATGTASASGEDFFRALTEHLARAFGVRHAMLAEIDADGMHARALAFRDGDASVPAFTYTLAGAPCELIVREGEVHFERGAARLFPEDRPLALRGIEGYYGVALCDRAGRAMGFISIMHTGPLPVTEQARSVMRIFATRAAMELERQRAEQALESLRRQFETAFRSSPAATSIFTSEDGRFVDCNDAYLKLLERGREEMIGRTGREVGIWHDEAQRERAFALRRQGVEVRDMECDLVTGTGKVIHCLFSWSWIEVNGARHILAHVVDLTDRIRAEQALRESEARFQDFAQASGDWFWETDADGRLVWASDSVEKATGYAPAAYLGRTRAEIAGENRDLSVEPWKSHLEALARHEPFRDFAYRREGIAEERWTSSSGLPRYGADGRFLGYRGAGTDITAKVLAERKANEAVARLRTAIEHLDEGFALWDRDERLVICNRKYVEFSGAPHLAVPGVAAGELLRAQAAAGHAPEAIGREQAWVEERLAARREVAEGGEIAAGEIQRGERWFIGSNQRLPDGALVTILIDFTTRKHAEDAVRESRRRFAALFHESAVPQLVSNSATRVNEDANRAFCELTGYSRERIVGQRGQDLNLFWSEADRDAVRSALPDAAAPLPAVEVSLRRADGTQLIALVSGREIELDSGRQVAWSVIDVTDRSRAEGALRESEERFQAMFNDSPAAQAVVDAATLEYVNVNPAWSELTGHAADAVLGRTAQSIALFSEESRLKLGERLEREGRVVNAEVTMRRRDGSMRRCLLSGRRITSKGRSLNVWWSIDVTAERAAWRRIEEMNASLERTVAGRTAELQQANAGLKAALEELGNSQEALLRSEKLAALGRLVAGVAHELNTPIGNSLLSATTLHEHTEVFGGQAASGGLRRSALDSYVAQAREATGILVRNLGKAAELISSFKQVAADQTSSQRRGFALDDVVREVLLAHRPMLKRSAIEVRTDVPATIRLESYPGPLGQVLGNLVTNAVLHGYEGVREGAVTVSARLDGDNSVEIAVRDDGRGIPEAEQKRIFDPFYTTRMGRGGTGLGLGICHNIVTDALGGTMRVVSRPGEGATFIVRIPLTAPVSAAGNREAA